MVPTTQVRATLTSYRRARSVGIYSWSWRRERSSLPPARPKGLTQETAARRAGTSQPTLSAYERGTKSPTLPVLERILRALGYELDLVPRVTFHPEPLGDRGRTFQVPDRLWHLDPPDCFAPVTMMLSTRQRVFDLMDRTSRAEAYAHLLARGTPEQLLDHVDCALLIDVWPDVYDQLHPAVRRAWAPLIFAGYNSWFREMLNAERDRPRVRPVSRRAQARAIRRMADHGLTEDQILDALYRRSDRDDVPDHGQAMTARLDAALRSRP